MKLNSRPKRVQRDESLIILTLITKDDARPLNAIQLINYTIDTIGVNHLWMFPHACQPFDKPFSWRPHVSTLLKCLKCFREYGSLFWEHKLTRWLYTTFLSLFFFRQTKRHTLSPFVIRNENEQPFTSHFCNRYSYQSIILLIYINTFFITDHRVWACSLRLSSNS